MSSNYVYKACLPEVKLLVPTLGQMLRTQRTVSLKAQSRGALKERCNLRAKEGVSETDRKWIGLEEVGVS